MWAPKIDRKLIRLQSINKYTHKLSYKAEFLTGRDFTSFSKLLWALHRHQQEVKHTSECRMSPTMTTDQKSRFQGPKLTQVLTKIDKNTLTHSLTHTLVSWEQLSLTAGQSVFSLNDQSADSQGPPAEIGHFTLLLFLLFSSSSSFSTETKPGQVNWLFLELPGQRTPKHIQASV